MAYKDLREFLKDLDKKGYLHKITAEVDWNEEVGAIAQEAMVRKEPVELVRCETKENYSRGFRNWRPSSNITQIIRKKQSSISAGMRPGKNIP